MIGDIHGQYDRLIELLRDDAQLISKDLSWSGQDATLWFMGDFFDRGPDGVSAVELFMHLQTQAHTAGGRVEVLIGNHDILIMAAERFGYAPTSGANGTFLEDWRRNGGLDADITRLTPDHIAWLVNLPAMRLDHERLFIHADAWFYTNYGTSVDAVNRAFRDILHHHHTEQWDALLDAFSEHRTFIREDGTQKAHKFLRIYGGRQIVHGHTPISKVTGQDPRAVVAPLVYAVNRCVNVDSGMYLGGPGFIHELPPL